MRAGAGQALAALLAGPLLLGIVYALPTVVDLPEAVVRWLPAVPAAILLLLWSAVHDLAARTPEGDEDRALPIAAVTVGGLVFAVAAGFAVTRGLDVDGNWALLGRVRLPATVLLLWATCEVAALQRRRIDDRALAGPSAELGGWAILAGLLFVLPDVVPGLIDARDYLGALTAPLTLLLGAVVAFGGVRLAALLWELARSGDAVEL